jgi:hypothetical protein
MGIILIGYLFNIIIGVVWDGNKDFRWWMSKLYNFV